MKILSDFLFKSFEGQTIDKLYSSSMKRCIESADFLSKDLNIPINELGGMAEIDFGEWEGCSFEYLEQKDPVLFHKWINNPIDNNPPGGESLKDLKKRVSNGVKVLQEKIEDDKCWKIILFSHKGPITLLLLDYLKLDLNYFWNFKINRGSITKINLYPRFSELEYLNRQF